MYCYHCGAQNIDQARFCQKCGQALVPVPKRPSVWNRWRGRYPCWLIPAIAVLSVLCLADVIIVALLLLLPAPQKGTIAVAVGPTPSYSTPTTAPTLLPTAALTLTPTGVPPARLRGRVIDKDTARPVAGARVVIGDRETITNQDGRFEVVGLSGGQYAVLATKDGYDPILSAIVSVGEGEAKNADVALFPQGTASYPKDPMSTHQIDPNGAPTAEDAERLAREQGLSRKVVAAREVMLQGEYLVNYKVGEELRSAKVALHHAAWELTDEKGQVWNIVRACGNLAMAVPTDMTIPAQCVARASTAQPTPTPTPTPAPAGVSQGEMVWSELVKISNNISGSYIPSMAFDSKGNLHAVWEDWNARFGKTGVHYARWDGTSWSPQVDIPGSGYGEEPALAVDRNDNVHVVWEKVPPDQPILQGDIYYSRFDGTSWSEPINLSNTGDKCYTPNIAVDGQNNLHVVWHYTEGYRTHPVYHTTWSEAMGWATPSLLLDSAGTSLPMAIDPSGKLHLAWDAESSLFHSKFEGTVLSSPVSIYAIQRTGTVHFDLAIAVDSQGRVHVVWGQCGPTVTNNIADTSIHHSVGEAGMWSPAVKIKISTKEGGPPAIAIDSLDRVHLVWSGGYGGYYARWDGTKWSTPVKIIDGNIPAVAVDSKDNIHTLWLVSKRNEEGKIQEDFFHMIGTIK